MLATKQKHKMKLPTYQELVDGTADKAMIPSRTNSAKKKCELEVAKLEEEVASQQLKLNEACLQKELNFEDICNRCDAIDLKTRRLEQMNDILTQLFPSVTAK